MSNSKKQQPSIVEQTYQLITSPLSSEKATYLSEKGQIVFLVTPEATKPKIKKAVESFFSVKVKAVNIILQKGKRKRFKGVWGTRKNSKKAIITLEKGHNIELLTEVKS